MKTQIIHLDAEDDHHSAREKLRWAKAARVVLIWPGRGRSLVRKLDLILLQRQAKSLGIQLGLISFDPQVVANAEDLGLPVFQNIEHIDQEKWDRPRRSARNRLVRPKTTERLRLDALPRSTRSSRALPNWARLVCFLVPVLLTIGVIAASYPSATIILEPSTTVGRYTYEVVVEDLPLTSTGLELQSMTVEVDGALRIPTTGEARAPDGTAAGDVQLTNLSSEALLLHSGTRLLALSASGQSYETIGMIELAAGEEASISIRSLEPGPAGNLEPGATWAMEGEFGLLIDVQNADPITGGSLAMRRAVSPTDLLDARRQLQEQLQTRALGLIEQSLTSEQMLVPGSLHVQQTLASTQDRDAGALGDSVEVYLSITFEGMLANTTRLRQVLENRFQANLAEGQIYQPASLSIQEVYLEEKPNGSQVLTASIVANSLVDVDRSTLAMRLRGARLAELDQIVRESAAGSSVESLQIRPGWLRLLPLFEFQITVAFPWEAPA